MTRSIPPSYPSFIFSIASPSHSEPIVRSSSILSSNRHIWSLWRKPLVFPLRWHSLFSVPSKVSPLSLHTHARGTIPNVLYHVAILTRTHTLCSLCHRSAHDRLRDSAVLRPHTHRSHPVQDPLSDFGSLSRQALSLRASLTPRSTRPQLLAAAAAPFAAEPCHRRHRAPFASPAHIRVRIANRSLCSPQHRSTVAAHPVRSSRTAAAQRLRIRSP